MHIGSALTPNSDFEVVKVLRFVTDRPIRQPQAETCWSGGKFVLYTTSYAGVLISSDFLNKRIYSIILTGNTSY